MEGILKTIFMPLLSALILSSLVGAARSPKQIKNTYGPPNYEPGKPLGLQQLANQEQDSYAMAAPVTYFKPKDTYGPPNHQPGSPLGSAEPAPPSVNYMTPPNYQAPSQSIPQKATVPQQQQDTVSVSASPPKIEDTYGPPNYKAGNPLDSQQIAIPSTSASNSKPKDVYGPPGHKPGKPLGLKETTMIQSQGPQASYGSPYQASSPSDLKQVSMQQSQQQLSGILSQGQTEDSYRIPILPNFQANTIVSSDVFNSQQQASIPKLKDIYGPPNHEAGVPLNLRQLSTRQTHPSLHKNSYGPIFYNQVNSLDAQHFARHAKRMY